MYEGVDRRLAALEASEPVHTIGDALLHHWLLMAAIVGCCLVIALGLALKVHRNFEAQATLYVDPRADAALQQSDGLLSRFFIQESTSDDTLTRASLTLKGSENVQSSKQNVTAQAVRGTNIIAISAKSADAQRAADWANAVAKAAVEQNRADVVARTQPLVDYVTSEVRGLDNQTKTALDQLAAVNERSPVLANQLLLVGLQTQSAAAYKKLIDIRSEQEQNASALSVLQLATPPSTKSGVPLQAYLASGVILGLVLAVGVALVVDRFDHRLFGPQALAAAAGTPSVTVTSLPEVEDTPAPLRLTWAHLIAAGYDSKLTVIVPASEDVKARHIALGLGLAADAEGSRVIVLAAVDSESAPEAERGPVSRASTGFAVIFDTHPSANGTHENSGHQSPVPAHAQPGQQGADLLRVPLKTECQTYTFVAVEPVFRAPLPREVKTSPCQAILVATARRTHFQEAQDSAQIMRQAGIEVVASVLDSPSRHLSAWSSPAKPKEVIRAFAGHRPLFKVPTPNFSRLDAGQGTVRTRRSSARERSIDNAGSESAQRAVPENVDPTG